MPPPAPPAAVVHGAPVLQGAPVVQGAEPWTPPATDQHRTACRLQQTYRVGRVLGIDLHIHSGLPLFWALCSILGAAREGVHGFFLDLLVYGPFLFGDVLLHELCHCLMARRLGMPVASILLWPLGGLAYIGRAPSACADLKVAAAGPASHVPQVLLWWSLWAAVRAPRPHLRASASRVPGRADKPRLV